MNFNSIDNDSGAFNENLKDKLQFDSSGERSNDKQEFSLNQQKIFELGDTVIEEGTSDRKEILIEVELNDAVKDLKTSPSVKKTTKLEKNFSRTKIHTLWQNQKQMVHMHFQEIQ